jgi:UDP-N-acetylmuramyl pentapeptide phosphotransferase/UDP-N-acetylglucosamine-1-phosphate transferase
MLLFDMAPTPGGLAIFFGVAFFLVLAAAAFIAFKLLKRSMRMAFRLAVGGLVLVLAIVGSAAFFYYGTSKPERPRRVVAP